VILVEAHITLETGGLFGDKGLNMKNVFVVDEMRTPLDPVHPGRARLLLSQGKAAVLRRYPFTIILKTTLEHPQVPPLRVKLDPGSRTTGFALVNDATGEVVWAAELTHRGEQIKQAMDTRRAVRRSRRQRHTRYRQPRFLNRRRKYQRRALQDRPYLPPSLESRLANVLTWVQRLMRFAPITTISMELVKFDTQAMDNPEISGVEYQQGTLAGYETREYLLSKWKRTCAYCGATSVPLQVEHIQARANGGTDRMSNLTLACATCNTAKGTLPIEVYLSGKPEVLKQIKAASKAPLKDASAVNSMRWALYRRLGELGLPVETGSGGRTKFNRVQRELPKAHWIDAACVGQSTPEKLLINHIVPLQIVAKGHGSRQMCNVKFGFPCSKPKGAKRVHGFQTGDLIRAVVPEHLKTRGTHVGRVLVRASGSFDLTTNRGRIAGISHRFCKPVHRSDGYSYATAVGTTPIQPVR
jgi:5-methylcytosine-specific restriction endonuclease McrA